jgi:hypothetical protein
VTGQEAAWIDADGVDSLWSLVCRWESEAASREIAYPDDASARAYANAQRECVQSMADLLRKLGDERYARRKSNE